ncbi:hypothetical protein RI129_006953 [Pyrocoelia pectoralis]|uniref:Kinetochore protein SPC25 n=1 Tax=Pyrocoelia pectoralis TaxID=417401 RepID=A0AAN7VA63_9COLE
MLSQVDNFCKLADHRKESNQIKTDCQILDAELCFLLHKICLKENTIRDLKQQLQQKKEVSERLKLEQETTSRNNQNKLNAFQSALNHFTNNFQYVVNKEDSGVETDKYCVTLSFIINAVTSQYPIRFIFDRNTDKLLNFDVKELLTEVEHNFLSDLYTKKRNNLALLCRLRNITKKRMCKVESTPEVNGCM